MLRSRARRARRQGFTESRERQCLQKTGFYRLGFYEGREDRGTKTGKARWKRGNVTYLPTPVPLWAQVGIGGVVKLADFGPLGRLGCARAAEACTYSAPEVLRKVGVLAASRAMTETMLADDPQQPLTRDAAQGIFLPVGVHATVPHVSFH